MTLLIRRSLGLLALFLVGLVGLLPFASSGQNAGSQKAAPALTQSQALLEAWNEIGRKLTAMAEDFPEDKYDFRPAATQRTRGLSMNSSLLYAAASAGSAERRLRRIQKNTCNSCFLPSPGVGSANYDKH